MPLTTHETRHTARTYTQQTFRTTIVVWRPSDGTHNSRPILHGKDYALSRTIRGTRIIEHGVGPDAANDA